MRVLVTEDEELLAELIARGLRRAAIAVDIAHDGDGALERLAVNDYDVVVLDRDLPGTHGDDVCRWVVAEASRTRVLMLTASRTVPERVAGLRLGADDYLTKPFDFAELLARVQALGRRAGPAIPPVLEKHGIRLDPARRQVTRDGEFIRLAHKEFAVLATLLAADGTVVSAEALLERVWDENIDPFSHTVRVTMSKLRAKLGEPQVIRTVQGSGYLI